MSENLQSQFEQHIRRISERASNALEASGFESLVVAAGSLQYRFLDDREVPFVANPQFRWWVPVADVPGCLLIFTPGDTPKLLYSIPEDFWHQSATRPDAGWTQSVSIEVFADRSAVEGDLPRGAKVAFIGDPSEIGLAQRQGWAVNPEQLIDRLHWARACKTDYEIECLAEANRVAAVGHRAAQSSWADGGSEFEIHLAYLRATGHTDDELPYHSIVATGRHGAVLHYQHRQRERPAEAGNAFLLDAGASARGYASDITRTLGAGSELFSSLITRMDRAQRDLASQVVPGTDYREIHLAAHRKVGEILCEAGLFRGDPDACLEQGITRAFFPHGVGHYLGLQVHDVGGHQAAPAGGRKPPPEEHPFLRLTRQLEAGHVVTIEPGLYFIPMLLDPLRERLPDAIDWRAVDALLPFGGIRIEDNVVATPEGARNLTREAFEGLRAG